MTELSNQHDCEDCDTSCTHPDHAFDGPIPDLWQLLLGEAAERTFELETASQGFVSL